MMKLEDPSVPPAEKRKIAAMIEELRAQMAENPLAEGVM
jgi:hypothetical protein